MADLEAEVLADMESNPETYLDTAEKYLVIDNDLRTITIPTGITIIGVESDDGVNRLHFKMSRTYGEFDLSEFTIRINFMNRKKVNGIYVSNAYKDGTYLVDDTEVDGDYIKFSWLVGRNAVKYMGDTKFIVCLKKTDYDGIVVKEFNTSLAILPSLEGLEVGTPEPDEDDKDVIAQLLAITEAKSNEAVQAVEDAKTQALEEIVQAGGVAIDDTLTDNTKAAPAGIVGELKGEIADKATLENGVVKFWKASTEESRTDTLLYSVDISSIGGTGGLDLENLTLSVSQVGNYQRLSMSDGTTTKNVDIPITTITDEQVQNAVNNYMAANPIDETDPTVPDWAKNPQKPTYTASEVGALPDTTKIPSKTSDLQNDSGFLTQHQDLSGYALKSEIPKVPSDIGAESEGTAESKVSEHNVSDTAHNDIRLLVQGLTERLNALADSDDTTLDQMSEIVSYIKYNRSLINGIDTNKVDVSDIVNSLISNNTDKPLSAKQGRVLKSLIDAIIVPTKLSELENDSGYAKTTDIPDKLPNPQKLTFAGAITAEYDGSGAVTVTIPESSGGSGVSDEKIAEAVGTYMETHPIEETDPTVPEWAKQQEKPSYTAEEVEALPNTTTTLPNPYPLTFTGGASGSYDGSEALTINIPSGGDGSTYYVTPEQFRAVGDGTTDDTEAFRQAIETELPIICMTGKDYYFANEIVTSKTRINIDGNYSHFTAFRLKINLNEDETNWKTSYPHPDSVIQNVYFMNKNNMDYCIKTGIPIKFVNIDVYYYDLWLKNYGDYMDYMVFDNLAINSRPSNEHYCIELSYLGDNHVFRECRFGGYDTNINYVQVSGCKAVNFIDCIINGNVIAYQSVVNLNGCHFENNGQIICGDTNVNSVINFNGCFFYDQYSVTPGKNVFYNGCEFLVNYRAYGGQNDYMALNTRDCIILCGAESANSNSNVIIDELRKNEYPNVVYSGNKVVFTPVVLKHTAKTWRLSAGTYTYKFFQSCNPYSIDYGDPAYSTGEESVTVDADTSAVQFRSDYDTYPEMFIHAYRTAPDGSIKKVVIPINGQYIYDYGETLNGILWKEVESIPTPKSTTAVYHNGIYYSGKNYTNARNCICVDKANSAIVRIDENGSPTIISGSGSGGLTESQVNNLIDAKLTGVETLLGGGF